MRSQYMYVKVAQKNESCQQLTHLPKVDKALEAFVSYQQAADRRFMEAEEARERRDEEREEKRRKEDQEFLLKLAQVLQK
jgi:hypothetical protein